jgi:hypothetical protein
MPIHCTTHPTKSVRQLGPPPGYGEGGTSYTRVILRMRAHKGVIRRPQVRIDPSDQSVPGPTRDQLVPNPSKVSVLLQVGAGCAGAAALASASGPAVRTTGSGSSLDAVEGLRVGPHRRPVLLTLARFCRGRVAASAGLTSPPPPTARPQLPAAGHAVTGRVRSGEPGAAGHQRFGAVRPGREAKAQRRRGAAEAVDKRGARVHDQLRPASLARDEGGSAPPGAPHEGAWRSYPQPAREPDRPRFGRRPPGITSWRPDSGKGPGGEVVHPRRNPARQSTPWRWPSAHDLRSRRR